MEDWLHWSIFPPCVSLRDRPDKPPAHTSRDPGRSTSSIILEEITIKHTKHTIAARIVPFLLALAVFGLVGVQTASAAPASAAPGSALAGVTGLGGTAAGRTQKSIIGPATPARVVAPIPLVTKPSGKNVLTPEQVAMAAQQAGFSGSKLVTAVAVAMAESTCNANAVSRSRAYGLWQILARAHPDLIRSSDPNASRWFDPFVNARFAWKVSSGGKNWRPWTTYTGGSYKKYLTRARAAVLLLATSPQSIPVPVAK